MQSKLELLKRSDVINLTNYRNGEIKLAERVYLIEDAVNWQTELKNNPTRYALIGISEDIGIKANFGRVGSKNAWQSFLKSFLNLQHNRFCKGSWVTILGNLDFEKESQIAHELDPYNKEDRKKLFELVQNIDKEVSHLIAQVVSAGKIPIIIGGGHNNAYGNIKGTALAKGKAINAINFDAHTDFRPLEGRHSGNGFSYAFEEGFLKNYFIWGLHENYTSKAIFTLIKENQHRVKYNTYEQIKIRREKSFDSELITASKHIDHGFYGIEIDLDSMPFVASSASTPSGFSIEKAREFIHYFARSKQAAYLHICEGAPELDSLENRHLVGKLICYLVTDFLKSNHIKH
ncbi:formimidoylglutamase [Myroides sp. LJL119]